jgi:hypothetical protein
VSPGVDPYAVPDELAAVFVQVKKMAEALRGPHPPRFFVMLTRYYIEGVPCRASGLTVSETGTRDLVQTQTGFTCQATFEEHMLSPAMRRGKQVREGRVTVPLVVELADIMLITVVPAD